MKKKLITKKKVFASIFALAVVIIIGLNVILFPKLLQMAPNSSDVIVATYDEVNLNSANEALGNIITEETALSIAYENVTKEDLTYSFDFDSASVTIKYVYDSSSFPAKNPIWIVIYMNSYENYDLQIPKELIEKISESAWKSKQVWANKNGDVFAHYDKYTGYIIAEIDAVTGKYIGYTYMSDEDDVSYENSVAAYLKQIYDIDLK